MSNRNLPNLFGRRSTPSSSIKQQRQHAQPFDMESKIDSDNEETVIIDRSPGMIMCESIYINIIIVTVC